MIFFICCRSSSGSGSSPEPSPFPLCMVTSLIFPPAAPALPRSLSHSLSSHSSTTTTARDSSRTIRSSIEYASGDGLSKYTVRGRRSSVSVISRAILVLPPPGMPVMRTSAGAPPACRSLSLMRLTKSDCGSPCTKGRLCISGMALQEAWSRNGAFAVRLRRLCRAGCGPRNPNRSLCCHTWTFARSCECRSFRYSLSESAGYFAGDGLSIPNSTTTSVPPPPMHDLMREGSSPRPFLHSSLSHPPGPNWTLRPAFIW